MFLLMAGSFTVMNIDFYSSGEVLCFPSHYAEIVLNSVMACDVTMFINRGRGFMVLFKPFSKNGFPSIIFIKLYTVIPKLIYHSTFMCDGVLILEDHQKVLDGGASFAIYLYPMFTSDVLKTPTKSSSVRHYHVNVVVFVVLSRGTVIGVFGVISVFVVTFSFKPIESPIRITASLKSPTYMFFFLL